MTSLFQENKAKMTYSCVKIVFFLGFNEVILKFIGKCDRRRLLFLDLLSQLETFNVSPDQGSVGIQILEVSIAPLLRHLRVKTLVRHEVGVDIRVLGVVPDLLHLLLAGHEEEPAVNLLRRRAGGGLVKAGKHLTAWGDNWIHHSGNYLIKPRVRLSLGNYYKGFYSDDRSRVGRLIVERFRHTNDI